jgi:hypothetical protein
MTQRLIWEDEDEPVEEWRGPNCPSCGSTRTSEILYGLPDFSPALKRNLKEGRYVLGGCMVAHGDPKWHCRACRHRWGGRTASLGTLDSN